ncbi:MAG: DUF362 domain-containing protein [Desulfobacterales bacterium]
MPSTVYFADLRATTKESFVDKIGRLADTAGLSDCLKKRDLVAVKLHFGELGNTAFIRPVFLGKIVDHIRRTGALPFLTDANTLYAGTRSNAPAHLTTAIRNGFAYPVVDAPLVIADGLRGKSETSITIGQKRFDTVFIGSEIAEADALISVAHFKGHELSGFGGTIKNLGMGCASRKGKLAQHSSVSPQVKEKKCVGCGDCVAHCSQSALALVERVPAAPTAKSSRSAARGRNRKKAVIDAKRCIGCGECILICPNGAIDIAWNQSIPIFLENMVEYTLGVLKGKSKKALFLNFITDVSPACDCYSHNDAPIVSDIGVVASRDPVAIDQASVDLVNLEPALAGCCLKTNRKAGEDKFSGLYPKVDWKIQLEYAQQLGLGRRDYRIQKI